MRRSAVAAFGALLAFASASTAFGAANDTTLVSRASGPTGAKGNGTSSTPSSAISANGRFVVFSSSATNLVPADTDPLLDIYVRDLQTGTTTLASVSSAETKGNSDSGFGGASISADGSRVAFESAATNLDAADTDSGSDVYVRNLTAGTTTLASVATNGMKGDGSSDSPSISGNGTRVGFQSSSTNLAAADTDSTLDIYVRNLSGSTTTLASRAFGLTGAVGNDDSLVPSLSNDGTKVAFESQATNLAAGDSTGDRDVYVRDTAATTTTLVSRANGAAGAKGTGASEFPGLSADGTRVSFESTAANLDPDDTDTIRDIFVRDLTANTTTLASRAAGASGAKSNGASEVAAGAISADGTRVAFASEGKNLDAADTDSGGDIFVRDLSTERTALASRASGPSGVKGSDSSFAVSIAANGGAVAFSSDATNLDPLDFTDDSDVYVREISFKQAKPPKTKIIKVGIKPKQRRAAFTFKAIGDSNGFQCALTRNHKHKPKFKSCKSPKVYRHLRVGKYTFEVRAIGDGGKDASPAKEKFKI